MLHLCLYAHVHMCLCGKAIPQTQPQDDGASRIFFTQPDSTTLLDSSGGNNLSVHFAMLFFVESRLRCITQKFPSVWIYERFAMTAYGLGNAGK